MRAVMRHRCAAPPAAALGAGILALALFVLACDGAGDPTPAGGQTATPEEDAMALSLQSDAFAQGGSIPRRYTCDGDDLSPALSWSGAPQGTQAFALIMDDPDAPGGTFTHWVLYDLPPDTSSLPEGVPADAQPASGGIQGRNDFRNRGYGGPCPPAGPAHRYNFTLYALDRASGLNPSASKQELLGAMQGHILAQATLTGTYGR